MEPEEREAYGARRREEAVRAAGILGPDPARFGGLQDGGLAQRPGVVDAAVRAQLEEFGPDLILCPSPAEIHPDHRALARSLFGLVASSRPADPDHDLYRFLRMAFYEISHPLLPNLLVDIADGAARKAEALAAYASQQEVRDYAGAMRA